MLTVQREINTGEKKKYTSIYTRMYSILTPRCCVFSVKQFPFIKKRACCESKQAGVTVFLNAESSFTGDPHFSKVFVEESKRYGLFR